MKMAVAVGLSKSHTYLKYRNITTKLLSEGKVSGNTQSEALLDYTRLNESRMNRLDKKLVVPEALIKRLLAIKNRYIWLVISEGWCGDAAQLIPVFNKLATLSPNIELKLAFRDENEPLMQAFLTNGARSIPKLIVLEADTNEVRAIWGPRPKAASDFIASYKSQYGSIDETARTELHLWYTNDKGISTQIELLDLMEEVEMALYAKR
ncbi:thioredoxin family protein [Flavobacterium selenitireducens]|uniref:thioredoxin family protein n=1 Tax=Flavobacterium selenitireducens TaxID=2722704 RepID=UPI00168B542C|nr:thioredoxin family protein [Flavobacterium selenitireducens]MBD3581950.1 thioredoxin family protein [Flavobacterium selenitireducens]